MIRTCWFSRHYWVLLMLLCFTPIASSYDYRYLVKKQPGAGKSECCLELDIAKAYNTLTSHTPYPSCNIRSLHRTNSGSTLRVFAELIDGIERRGREPIDHTDSGSYESIDNGHTWKKLIDREEIFSTIIRPDDVGLRRFITPSKPEVVYRKLDKALALDRSQDGGKSWRRTPFIIARKRSSVELELRINAIDADDPYTLYAYIGEAKATSAPSFRSGIYRSVNGGDDWSFFTDEVYWLALSPSNPLIIYGCKGGLIPPFQLKKSVDGGRTWSVLGISEVLDVPWRQEVVSDYINRKLLTNSQLNIRMEFLPRIYQMVLHPSNVDVVFVVTNYGILRSMDGGNFWCLLSVGMPYFKNVNSLAIDPIGPHTIFVGTDGHGLWKSNDMGCSWVRVEIEKGLRRPMAGSGK